MVVLSLPHSQVFSSLSSVKTLVGISASGCKIIGLKAPGRWGRHPAKTGQSKGIRHGQTLAVTADFAGGREEPRSWQVSWSPSAQLCSQGLGVEGQLFAHFCFSPDTFVIKSQPLTSDPFPGFVCSGLTSKHLQVDVQHL